MTAKKPFNRMDKTEQAAYLDQNWDGIDRREIEPDTKEYERALRQRAQRSKDRQTKILHYTIVGLLFIVLFGSLMIASLLERAAP